MTDYAQLRCLLQTAPSNQHLGIEILDIELGAAVTCLRDPARISSYLGNQLATGTHVTAEAAAWSAVVGTFLSLGGDFIPTLQSSEVTCSPPARDRLIAVARLRADPQELRATASVRGHVDVVVDVSVRGDGDFAMATAVFCFEVRRLD